MDSLVCPWFVPDLLRFIRLAYGFDLCDSVPCSLLSLSGSLFNFSLAFLLPSSAYCPSALFLLGSPSCLARAGFPPSLLPLSASSFKPLGLFLPFPASALSRIDSRTQTESPSLLENCASDATLSKQGCYQKDEGPAHVEKMKGCPASERSLSCDCPQLPSLSVLPSIPLHAYGPDSSSVSMAGCGIHSTDARSLGTREHALNATQEPLAYAAQGAKTCESGSLCYSSSSSYSYYSDYDYDDDVDASAGDDDDDDGSVARSAAGCASCPTPVGFCVSQSKEGSSYVVDPSRCELRADCTVSESATLFGGRARSGPLESKSLREVQSEQDGEFFLQRGIAAPTGGAALRSSAPSGFPTTSAAAPAAGCDDDDGDDDDADDDDRDGDAALAEYAMSTSSFLPRASFSTRGNSSVGCGGGSDCTPEVPRSVGCRSGSSNSNNGDCLHSDGLRYKLAWSCNDFEAQAEGDMASFNYVFESNVGSVPEVSPRP